MFAYLADFRNKMEEFFQQNLLLLPSAFRLLATGLSNAQIFARTLKSMFLLMHKIGIKNNKSQTKNADIQAFTVSGF